jgi:myeloid leukemia factor 1
MRSMRQMNNMMNSLFADPFGMFGGGMGGMHGMGMGGHMQMNNLEGIMGPPPHMMRSPHARHNAIMPFGGMGGMNMNRLLNTDHMPENGLSYSSSSVFSMSSGPDGPQVYQASSSTR